MKRPYVPVSSYAALQARRRYYSKNKEALRLRQKMYRAGVPFTTQQCREML
jgi:hypothetical protein